MRRGYRRGVDVTLGVCLLGPSWSRYCLLSSSRASISFVQQAPLVSYVLAFSPSCNLGRVSDKLKALAQVLAFYNPNATVTSLHLLCICSMPTQHIQICQTCRTKKAYKVIVLRCHASKYRVRGFGRITTVGNYWGLLLSRRAKRWYVFRFSCRIVRSAS